MLLLTVSTPARSASDCLKITLSIFQQLSKKRKFSNKLKGNYAVALNSKSILSDHLMQANAKKTTRQNSSIKRKCFFCGGNLHAGSRNFCPAFLRIKPASNATKLSLSSCLPKYWTKSSCIVNKNFTRYWSKRRCTGFRKWTTIKSCLLIIGSNNRSFKVWRAPY